MRLRRLLLKNRPASLGGESKMSTIVPFPGWPKARESSEIFLTEINFEAEEVWQLRNCQFLRKLSAGGLIQSGVWSSTKELSNLLVLLGSSRTRFF